MTYGPVDGAELWVEDTGGSAPPLVLVHAAAGSSACWGEQRPMFVDAGYRVITYDLRGFGRTRSEPGREAEGSIAADLEALTAKLDIAPFFLVGTAYGGFGVIEFALDNPALLGAVVLSTSFGGVSDPEFAALRANHIAPDLAMRPVVERELGASYRASNPEGVRRFIEMEQGSYRAEGKRQALRTPTTLSRLQTMRVPVLVIAGEEDAYAPPPVMQALAENIPGSEFEVMKAAGHSAYWEQPKVWNQLIVRFLRKHT
jgi:3-oxoadipate enol-lactonase